MFRAEKCKLSFNVDYDGKKVVIQRVSSNPYMSTSLTPVIMRSLVLLADLSLRKVPRLSRHRALMDYFEERGWKITRMVPSLVQNESGQMSVTFV